MLVAGVAVQAALVDRDRDVASIVRRHPVANGDLVILVARHRGCRGRGLLAAHRRGRSCRLRTGTRTSPGRRRDDVVLVAGVAVQAALIDRDRDVASIVRRHPVTNGDLVMVAMGIPVTRVCPGVGCGRPGRRRDHYGEDDRQHDEKPVKAKSRVVHGKRISCQACGAIGRFVLPHAYPVSSAAASPDRPHWALWQLPAIFRPVVRRLRHVVLPGSRRFWPAAQQSPGKWCTRSNLRIPELRQGSYLSAFLEPRRRPAQALLVVIQPAKHGTYKTNPRPIQFPRHNDQREPVCCRFASHPTPNIPLTPPPRRRMVPARTF